VQGIARVFTAERRLRYVADLRKICTSFHGYDFIGEHADTIGIDNGHRQ
jgi:hypothetical protein